MVPFFLSGNTITVYVPTPKVIDSTHPNFDEVVDRLRNPEVTKEELVELIDIPTAIAAKFDETGENIKIVDNAIFYKGEKLDGYFVNRILDHLAGGFPIEPLVRALDQLMENPSYRVREQLYKFLEAAHIAFQEDGRFLAFKKVRENYMDVHSGRFDNSVGKVVSMQRESVDDDPNRTCSAGLHVCSYNYLDIFPGERVVVVAVSPRDVVSVPADYNHAKMRTCRYEVVGEVELEEASTIFNDRYVVNDYNPFEVVGYDVDDEDLEVYRYEVEQMEYVYLGTDADGRDYYQYVD